MIGTGGIGHGSFFLITGNETLGREESRAGRYLDRRDYCKLHIICHYLRALLGDEFRVYPVGKVGDDDAGARLVREMRDAGVDPRFVERVPGRPTLSSFCFLYPDGSGGNLSTENSACELVDPASITAAEGMFASLGPRGIALAVPEVPLEARATLLSLATRHGLFRAASFTRAEIRSAREAGMFDSIDLLAVNLEEACAAAGMSVEGESKDRLVIRVSDILFADHPRLRLSVTAGAAGSWAGDAHGLAFQQVFPVKVEGTAGAGDAHVSGLLAGLCAGLDIAAALQLATLVAAASVASAHTINPDFSGALLSLAGDPALTLSSPVRALLDPGAACPA
jgi:ribokinase